MNGIRIYGGTPLHGQTVIQGSKNAVLPILAATLLIDGICTIENCPDISDVRHMLRLMESLCCSIKRTGHTLVIDAREVSGCNMPSDSVGVMRSSIMLLGALLARIGNVGMQYPGGCVIGARPIDQHLQGLRRMGVVIEEDKDGFVAETKGLTGALHCLPFVSVGATENLLLAAVQAKGETVIENAAREPEIAALCDFLNKAGARIEGIGTGRLVIQGVSKLHEVSYRIPADRIVAGTYLAAGLCAGGEIFLREAPVTQMQAEMQAAIYMGAELSVKQDGLYICCKSRRKMPPMIVTEPYPGFPTDLQSAFLTAMTTASGRGIIKEEIFENRFRIVSELRKLGAIIKCQQNSAIVEGVENLQGTLLYARELRGGAALVLAGLMAKGVTQVCDSCYIERGYEDICKDLRELGAACEWICEDM